MADKREFLSEPMTSIIQGRDSWKVRSRLRNNGVLLEEWDAGTHRSSIPLSLSIPLNLPRATRPKIREILCNICKEEKRSGYEIVIIFSTYKMNIQFTRSRPSYTSLSHSCLYFTFYTYSNDINTNHVDFIIYLNFRNYWQIKKHF